MGKIIKMIERELECRDCFKWALIVSLWITALVLFRLGVN